MSKEFEIHKIEYEYKSLRLPKDLIDEVNKVAAQSDVSFNYVVTECIRYALANRPVDSADS